MPMYMFFRFVSIRFVSFRLVLLHCISLRFISFHFAPHVLCVLYVLYVWTGFLFLNYMENLPLFAVRKQ